MHLIKKTRHFFVIFLMSALPLVAACGFFSEPGPDNPFIFPGVEDTGDGGSDGSTDLCADVTCPDGESCNASDGSCSISDPPSTGNGTGGDGGPECTVDDDCSADQICEAEACQNGCRDNDDCTSPQECNTNNNQCECPAVTCEAGETLNQATCECQANASEGACKVVWQAGIKSPENVGLKLYIDAKFPDQDLPNSCSTDNEALEFGCVKDAAPETDPALIKECNKFSGDSKADCLARANVRLIPFATRNERPINLYFVPDNNADPDAGGKVFIVSSEFPEYLIYNTSEDLQANLAIDAGLGELVAPGIQVPEVIGEGTYSVSGGKVSITDMPMRFRAINLVKFPPSSHVDPPPAIFDAYVSDYSDPGFNLEDNAIKASGITCSTTGLQGVSVLPDPDDAALVFTSGTNTDAQPDASISDSSDTITFTGCPIGPANECDCTVDPSGDPDDPACGTDPDSDPTEPWLRLVTGLTIPVDTCLAGLQGAALGAEIEGPVENADGTPFTDLATACAKTGDEGGSGSGNLVISVEVDDEPLTLEEESPNEFEGETAITDEPFYKEEADAGITDIDVLARFETIILVTVSNDGGSSDQEPTFDLSSTNEAFEVVGADLLGGTTLETGQEKTLTVRFAPEDPQPSGCEDNVDDATVWDCTTTIRIFEDSGLDIIVTASALQPAADIRIVEIGALQGENYNTEMVPALVPGDGEVDYGPTSVGDPVIKAYEISNNGVRDLTVNSVQSLDPNWNFLGGVVRQGPSLDEAVFSFGLLPTIVSPDNSNKLYFYETYWPGGILPDDPADCDGKPCRLDSGAVSVQTDAGARVLSLSGAMTLDLTARLEVYIEDPVLLDEGISENPHLINCGGLLPSNIACFDDEGETVAARRVDPDDGFSAFRNDSNPRRVFIQNGHTSPLADTVQVPSDGIVFDGGADAAQWDGASFLPADVFGEEDCVNLIGGTPGTDGKSLKLGTIAYIPDGGATSRTVHEATLDVTGSGVNQGTPCDGPVNDPLVLAGVLKGVSGAPTGSMDLKVMRMFAGINPQLTDGTKMVSTVTPGQASRAGLSNSEIDSFSIPVVFDAANGTIELQPVYTPLPEAFTGGSGEMRLFNPTASGSTPGIWLFREHCEIGGSNCSDFYLYISKNDPSFESEAPTPPIFTGYKASDALALKAKNPELTDFSGDLINAIGEYDPASGKVQFTNNIAIRMFMHPGTILSDRVDSAMVSSLTTECLQDAEGNSLVVDTGVSASAPAAILGASDFIGGNAFEDTPFSELDGAPSKLEMFGGNPMVAHLDGLDDCAAGANVLRGRRMGEPDNTDNLDENTLPTGLTFDIAGVAKLRHNSNQLSDGTVMYIVIKACVETGPGSCDID